MLMSIILQFQLILLPLINQPTNQIYISDQILKFQFSKIQSAYINAYIKIEFIIQIEGYQQHI